MRVLHEANKIFESYNLCEFPKRAKVIKNIPPLSNVTNLQAFLDLANYYCIYIPKMYDLRAPLNDLLKKSAK